VTPPPRLTQVIVLNGGSSSGKSTIARELQEMLPRPWLTFGVDSFIEALPQSLQDGGALEIKPDGQIVVGEVFRTLEAAWMAGVAAMVRAGARIILDEAFLGGGESQARWQAALRGLTVLWAGVHCAPGVAAQREAGRAGRIPGMAGKQADLVHAGVTYDVEVDTTSTGAREAALAIAPRVMG
jgi:chloramphenicol 3-O phosphotransferase